MHTPRKESVPVTILAFLLAIASWGVGFYFLMPDADASLASISDKLSTSLPGAVATHTITFTNSTTTLAVGQTLVITPDPTGHLFGNIGAVTTSSFSGSTGVNVLATCSAGANNVSLGTSTNAITLTACATGVASGTKTIVIANAISNPTSTGSYVINVAFNSATPQTADTRVAVVNGVAVTASVDTTLTFTVAGMATGTSIGFATTTGYSTSTALSFGTLTPGSSSAKILGQTLTVTTNARNGYVVTVQQTQNMLSTNGAQINTFRDNNSTSTPSAWVSPGGILDATTTYGHYGFTSDNREANAGTGLFNATGTSQNLFVGNMAGPVPIMTHPGPSDGVATSSGRTEVGVKIEITPLQPAGNDYSNILWYVVTPTF